MTDIVNLIIAQFDTKRIVQSDKLRERILALHIKRAAGCLYDNRRYD
jgi:hypothetical protein